MFFLHSWKCYAAHLCTPPNASWNCASFNFNSLTWSFLGGKMSQKIGHQGIGQATGQRSMGSYYMHVGASGMNWMNWWMSCDVATPPTFNKSNHMVVRKETMFQLREVLWIAMSQREHIGFDCFCWFEWSLPQCSWFVSTGHCVCVLFQWWCRPIPLLEKETPFAIYMSGRVGVIVIIFLVCLLLDSVWVALHERTCQCNSWLSYMGVSKNNGTPKSSILIGVSMK